MKAAMGQHSPARTLSSAGQNERVRVNRIDGGEGLRTRLAAMGIMPGAAMSIVRNSLWGPLIVNVRGSRLVLGRGAADKIAID